MTELEMIAKFPDIVKVTPQAMNQVAVKLLGQELDFNKTFSENGFDELDSVEMVMELEKLLDIEVTDEVLEAFTSGKPPVFTQWVRNDKIEKLGL
jgi:acyl carrier protein